jgi:hypothetical protein
MWFAVPTEVLRHVREAAGVRQGTLAKRLNTNATFVSRLERETAAESEFAHGYLTEIGTDLAHEVIAYYDRHWSKVDPPSFLHPDREQIWTIERALKDLEAFEAGPQNSPILRPWIASLREDLFSVFRYLERVDHTIAWVGDIGVGKTTALAYATRLLQPEGRALKPIFPVGSGRITVAETKVKAANIFGVAVEALEADEIRSLLADLVNSYANGGRGGGVSTEMARVLRNMSGFRTRRQAKGADDFETVDPIVEALKAGEHADMVADRMLAAMNLPTRRESSVAHAADADGMSWLAKTVTGINNGMDERFSVPRRITVLVPSVALRAGGEVTVVDTKGVEGTTQRRDLRDYQDDARTLMVLCTKFPDAPGATPERLLRDQIEQGASTTERRRVCLLVLPREDEPLHVMENGEPPSSHAEGRAIRRDQIRSTLAGHGLPDIPILFFDAHRDTAEAVWEQLRQRIRDMRNFHVARLERTTHAIAELIGNVDIVKTRNARTEIERRIHALADRRIATIASSRRPAHLNLVEQLDIGHQSSVAAAVARRGAWSNFPIQHILGVGVRQDANLRTADNIGRIKHEFESLQDEFGEIAAVSEILASLMARVEEWRQDFLNATLEIGRDAYGNLLEEETALWTRSRARYGTHEPGYKKDLARMWTAYFETSAPAETRQSVEDRLADAWTKMIVEPLIDATRADEDVDLIAA